MSFSALNLARSFGQVHAVKNFSTEFQPGEIYSLIGPDAAGKTTIMRMLAGVMQPDKGEVHVNGKNLPDDDRLRSKIGYMPQAYGLYGDLSVRENLSFYAGLQGVKSKKKKERIQSLLKFVRLEKFPRRHAKALSGGMYKKLAIACAIVHNPEILILDEPTNGVDPVSRRELWSLLFSLSDEGVTVIVSTPYMDEAERAHRTGLIFAGEKVMEGKPSELLESIQGRLVGFHSDDISLAPRVRAELGENVAAAYPVGDKVHVLLKNARVLKKFHTWLAKNNLKEFSVRPGFEDLFMNIAEDKNERRSSK